MHRRNRVISGAVVLVLVSTAAYTLETQPLPATLILDRAVHFTAGLGNDIQLPPGIYRVEQAGDALLQLFPSGGEVPVEVLATPIIHDESLTSSVAMSVLEEGREDEVHLVVLLPGGQGFDATGSFSGTRKRGALGSALSRVQVQNAVNQIQGRPQAPPQQSAPLPSGTIIRVPPALAGMFVKPPPTGDTSSAPVSKTMQLKPAGRVTWDYLRMNDPDLIVEIITEVQAGRLDKNILTGLASPAKVSELLAQNYTTLKGQPGGLEHSPFHRPRPGNRWQPMGRSSEPQDQRTIGIGRRHIGAESQSRRAQSGDQRCHDQNNFPGRLFPGATEFRQRI